MSIQNLFAKAICLAVLAVLGLEATSQAQPPATQYTHLQYIKVERGKNEEFLQQERTIWMPVNRERIKAGQIKTWTMWAVRYPGGAEREYDYVIAISVEKFKDLETVSERPSLEMFAKAHPTLNREQAFANLNATRRVVRTEAVSLIESTQPKAETPSSAELPKYMRVDYKKVEFGKGADYVENERKYYKPVWQASVDAGTLARWAFYGVRMPGGANREYGFMTLQFFNRFEQLEGNPSRGLWEKVHPSVKGADLSAQMAAISRTVRSELLVRVESLR